MNFKPDFRPQLSPYLTVRDAQKSIDFYRDAFGFELVRAAEGEDGNIQHVEMRKGHAYIMFCPEGAFSGDVQKKSPITLGISMPINLYIYCEDADAIYKKAIAHNAKSIEEPQDAFWGDRFCMVMDHDGYEWGFCTLLNK